MNALKKIISIYGIQRDAIFSLVIVVIASAIAINAQFIFLAFIPNNLPQNESLAFKVSLKAEPLSYVLDTIEKVHDKITNNPSLQTLAPFDPNKSSFNQLTEMGLPTQNAADLIALKKAGLYFSNKESFENWANHFWGDSLLISALLPQVIVEQSSERLNSTASFGSPENKKIFNTQPFNPYMVSKNELETFGFKPEIAENIIQLRDSVGENNFNPTHIKYMKGLPIPEKKAFLNAADFNVKQETKNVAVKINLNEADSLALISVKGIGPYMAGKILAERRALGAFHSVQQIYLIKGLSAEYLDKVANHFFVTGFNPTYIKINRWDKHQLTEHPYIDWPTALNIVKFRKMYGWYKTPDELTKYPNLPDSLVLQLSPYLSFD
jgi:competence protein ComEA